MAGTQTYILILNYNGGEDTWHCLASVMALEDVQIFLLDNHSTDQSIPLICKNLETAGIDFTLLPDTALASLGSITAKICIITSAENTGFSRGINLMLEPLLAANKTGYVWLLNNDAIALPDTLQHLIAAMEAGERNGFAGSLILDERHRTRIQCAGVRYFKWLGVAKMLRKNEDLNSSLAGRNGYQPCFQHGASLLISMECIRATGLLDERFFLYSEEHDWQERGKAAGYGNALVTRSIIFHKGSMSTDSNKYLFYYYYCKSSVLFSRKHFSSLTAIIASLMLSGITLIRTKGNIKSMRWAVKGMKEAWAFPK